DLTQLAMTPMWTTWVEECLLPLMYWQEQLRRTRCPGQKAQIALVLRAVEEAFERHSCTRQLKPEASTEKYEAECATSETHRWVAVEGPSVPGVCFGITDGDEKNIVPRQCSPSSPARSLQ